MKTKLNIINISPEYSSIWKYGFNIYEALQNHPQLEPVFVDLWATGNVSANNIIRSLQLLHGLNGFSCSENDINLFTVPLLSRSLSKIKGKLNIMMIHDLWTLDNDNLFLRLLSHSLYPKSKTADLILTNSLATKHEYEEHYQTTSPIHPILLGIDSKFFHINQLEKDSNQPLTFISIGRDEHRKNLTFMIDILAKLKSKNVNFRVFRIGAFSPANQQKIEAAGLASNIQHYSNISEDDLIGLYQQSDYLLFPSFYEGFGLPVIEAMACSCIPLVSNLGSLPEVAERQEIILDLDVNKWVDKIIAIEKDKNSKAALIQFGLSHCRKFSWESYAGQLAEIILNTL